jgi:signal transduction histidine kinase
VYVEAGEREHRLVIKDQGIGIPTEFLGKLFQPFERAAPRDYGGLGMGLYIVRQIVEAHGGSISVESKPGSGATFTVVLPA